MWLVDTILGNTALDPALYVLSCETLIKFLTLSGKIKGYSRIDRDLQRVCGCTKEGHWPAWGDVGQTPGRTLEEFTWEVR